MNSDRTPRTSPSTSSAEDTRLTRALETAREAASAGAAVIARRGRDTGEVRIKGAQTDMVTETDIASGVAAVGSVLAREPDAGFVVEEDEVYDLAKASRGALDDAEVWVIDPLDGTTSFVHGFPCYSVSVALLRDGEPLAGAVANVVTGEVFSAARGMGAFAQATGTSGSAPRPGDPDTAAARQLHCTSTARLDRALMITGFPYDRTVTLDRQLDVLARFLRAPVHGIRRDGSAAVDCCHVAAGRADGFWEFGLAPWDTAAGVVILREAGAIVTDIDGEPWSTGASGIVAANPELHERMLEVIARR